MVKVLSSRMQECLGSFTVLLVKVSSERILFRYLSNHVFGTPKFRKYIGYDGHLFFWKCSKFNVDFINEQKNWKKFFYLWDNKIIIGCVKLSLLRREYLSSTLIVLTNTVKILLSTKRAISRLNSVHSDQQIW